jgi:hypothetical protein
MALCTVEDIQVRLGTPLEGDEALRVEAFIDDVSALIVAHCRGTEISDPPPDEIKAVCIAEVMRALNANPGIIAEEIGEISTRYQTYRFGLSADARNTLKSYRPNRNTTISNKGGGYAIQ